MNKRKLRFEAESFRGKRIDNHSHEHGWQVVAYDATTGRRVRVWGVWPHTTPVIKLGHVYEHYKTGVSYADQVLLDNMEGAARKMAEDMNRVQEAAFREE